MRYVLRDTVQSLGTKSDNSQKRLANDETIQHYLGQFSRQNPMKITSNTMFSNPIRIAAFYLFGKDYDDLN